MNHAKNIKSFFVISLILIVAAFVSLLIWGKGSALKRQNVSLENIDPYMRLQHAGFQFPQQAVKLPDVMVKTMEDEMVVLQSLFSDSKLVIINFWSEDCPPCIEEMLSIQENIAAARSKMANFLLINTSNNKSSAKEFLEEHSLREESFFIDQDSLQGLITALKIVSRPDLIPQTIVFDDQMDLKANSIGIVNWNDQSILKALLSIS